MNLLFTATYTVLGVIAVGALLAGIGWMLTSPRACKYIRHDWSLPWKTTISNHRYRVTKCHRCDETKYVDICHEGGKI